jgi:iron complex outermembrane receptor protein
MKSTLLLIVSFFILSTYTYAQQNGIVKGTVITSDGNSAEAVSVAIPGTNVGVMTNEYGKFQLNKIKPGTYTIRVSAIGLTTEEKTVTVSAGTTVVDFMLRENSGTLKEVAITTSRKRYKVDEPSATLRLGEPLIQVPQNIQVITSDQIKDQQIFSMLEGPSRNVSGLVLQEHWGNYALIYGRGDRIAPYRNGVNLEANWGPLNEDMSFVDRIEFVKGPAGFMLASGNPSGFYNVVTKKPTGVTRQSFEFTAGSFNNYRATADFDGKLTNNGKLQYRLNLMGQLSDSYRPFDFSNRFSIAPVLRYQFDDKNTLTAEYTYQRVRMSAFGSAYLFSTSGYKDLPRYFTNLPANSPASDIYDQSAFLNYEHKFSDKWKFTAQGAYLNYKQNAYSYWINSIADNGDINRSLGIWDASNRIKSLQAFVNGEIKTGVVKHRILSGVDIGDKFYIADYGQSGSLDPTTPFNIYNPNNSAVTLPVFDHTTPLSVRGAGATSIQHYQSLYVQDELGFLDQRLRLTLAGRYTHALTVDPYDGSANNKQFTPRVGVSFSVDPATSVYVVYDQSFLPQSGTLFDGGTVKPVTGNSLEAGIKRDWFNGKWSTSVSVYQILKNNQLVADPEHPNANYVIQLGQTKTHGVEFVPVAKSSPA